MAMAWRRVDKVKMCTCCWGVVVMGWEAGHHFCCDECGGHYGSACLARFHEHAASRQLCGHATGETLKNGRPERCGESKPYHKKMGHAWEPWPQPELEV
jgi:hypothetical protein